MWILLAATWIPLVPTGILLGLPRGIGRGKGKGALHRFTKASRFVIPSVEINRPRHIEVNRPWHVEINMPWPGDFNRQFNKP
jgi:hypothetical protein